MSDTATTRATEDEALQAAAEKTARGLEACQKAGAAWVYEVFEDEVRLALDNLRRYIEDPAEDLIGWGFPFVELTYPVEWDFEGRLHPPPGGIVSVTFSPEDLVDGVVPEDRIVEVLREAVRLDALSGLTRHVVEWREAGKTDTEWQILNASWQILRVEWREAGKTDTEGRHAYILPKVYQTWLDETTGTKATEKGVEGTPEAVEARRRAVEKLARPFSLGDFEAQAHLAAAKQDAREAAEELDNLTGREPTPEEWDEIDAGAAAYAEVEKAAASVSPLRFSAESDTGGILEGSVVALVYPLVVDADDRRAWFTMGVGLVFTKGDPRRWPEEDLAGFWDYCLNLGGAGDEETTSETSTKSTRSPKAGPPEKRTALALLDGNTLMDTGVAHLVRFMDGTKLPRKWGRIKKWDDLVQAEVDRLRDAHGEDAFVEVDGVRKALLRRKWTAAGVELVELTNEAERELKDHEGHKGFRGVFKDRDNVPREYLVKRFRAGGGYMEVRLSWYSSAWRLVAEELEEEEARALERKAETDGLLFDELREKERRTVDGWLRHLGTLKDAREVMDYVLRRFGMIGENPVHVPASEFRVLLECKQDDHGHGRVNGALRALQELRFDMKAAGVGPGVSGHAFGGLVSDVRYKGRGPGKHTDGDFYISLSDIAVGCLHVFGTAEGRIREPRRVFDFTAGLSKDEREKLDFVRSYTLAPLYDRAKGFTRTQRALREWVDHNLTLRKDAAAKVHKHAKVPPSASDANEPRLYGPSFCPLLEEGRRYHAPLGHFSRNPETGRKLKGRSQARTKTGGAKSGGLLEIMGYDLPPGRAGEGRAKVAANALQDLRAVVEEALGGRVIGKHAGKWITLTDAEKLHPWDLLEKVTWFLFLPEDWLDRVHADIEQHHQDRYERGETDRPVRVTTDRADYEKGLEDRGEAVEGVGLSDLRNRLRAARKDRGLSQAEVGRVFGVRQPVVSKWEQGPEQGGKAIPDGLRPYVLRWIETEEGPTEGELEELDARRRGSSRA